MPKKCYCGNDKLDEYSLNYYKCSQCNTLISKTDFNNDIYHVKSDELDLYGKNYWDSMMKKMTKQDSLDGVIDFYLNDRVIYWMKYILSYIPIDYKIAEIGCGLGQLAYVMKAIGYEQTAFELSPDICQFIKETLNINIVCGEFGESNEIYDAVLAFDLIEHIAEPEPFLVNIYDKLSENGIICLQLPQYDNTLDYNMMLKEKPRFANHLTEFQHIFLYSKDAIKQLLYKVGFIYIYFEPACFGEDYDMFLFASKVPLNKMSNNYVDNLLNNVNNGRLVKSIISLYDKNNILEKQLTEIENDSGIRLEKINKLEEKLIESESDRTARLEIINKQQSDINDLQKTINNQQKNINDQLKNIENYKIYINEQKDIINIIESTNHNYEQLMNEYISYIRELQGNQDKNKKFNFNKK